MNLDRVVADSCFLLCYAAPTSLNKYSYVSMVLVVLVCMLKHDQIEIKSHWKLLIIYL